MKIWKADSAEHIAEDSDVVFNFTGNHTLERYPSKPIPLDLTKPTLLYLPGKGTVVNAAGTDLSDASQEHVQDDTVQQIATNLAYSFHNAQQVRQVHLGDEVEAPDFYMMAYTDNLIQPPQGKNEKSWQGWLQSIESAEKKVKERLPYDDYKGSRLKQSFAHRANAGTFYSYDARLLVEDMLLPAISDDKGELLPKDEVKKRLSNLTMLGYSYGSVFCKEVENCLHDKLIEKGQSEADIQDMLKHVVTINAPSVARVATTRNLFTSYYFEARLDVLRRHVQKPKTQESRGVLGKVNGDLKTALRETYGEDAEIFQRVEEGNETARRLENQLPETLLGGFTETFKNEHGWKGLEIREWVKRPKKWVKDMAEKVKSNGNGNSDIKRMNITNGAIILHDAPNDFVECESLEQAYADVSPEGAERKPNQFHHEIGGILWSHQEQQCLPLLFNRLLHNALERGKEGGIYFDEESNHVRAMFSKTPQHDMMPDGMQERLETELSKGFMRGGLKPSTKETIAASTVGIGKNVQLSEMARTA